MIEQSRISPGDTYYSLMYYDSDCTISSINTYIYTGKNLQSTDSKEDKWYFQDPCTYLLYGTLVDYPNEFDAGVLSVDGDYLSHLYDIDGLIEKLCDLNSQDMEGAEFEPGKTYYLVKYHDINLTLPIFDAYIYIGKTEEQNHEGKVETLYLFQEPGTFILKGSQPVKPDILESDISADKASLHRFHDLNSLIALLIKLKNI